MNDHKDKCNRPLREYLGASNGVVDASYSHQCKKSIVYKIDFLQLWPVGLVDFLCQIKSGVYNSTLFNFLLSNSLANYTSRHPKQVSNKTLYREKEGLGCYESEDGWSKRTHYFSHNRIRKYWEEVFQIKDFSSLGDSLHLGQATWSQTHQSQKGGQHLQLRTLP